MGDFDTIFEQFQFTQKAEASIKEFSNWLFGISIGICALVISIIDGLHILKTDLIMLLVIIVLILSMINVFFTGIIKFLIFRRETRMMTSYGVLKKMAFFHQEGSTLDRAEFDQHFHDWSNEYNKITSTSRFFNISIILNFLTILTVGISVIMVFLNSKTLI